MQGRQNGDCQQQAQGGKTQADQCQVHRGRRGRGGHEEDVQPTPALHASQRQERGHHPGLLLRAGALGPGQPGFPMDQDATTQLLAQSKGELVVSACFSLPKLQSGARIILLSGTLYLPTAGNRGLRSMKLYG